MITTPSTYILRPFQNRQVESVFREWETFDSTMFVSPTGTGKSTTFTEIVRRAYPKRSMILVHREELLFQAWERVEKHGGVDCDLEMAALHSNEHSMFGKKTCVVATVQSLLSGNRLQKFRPETFGYLILDECHHYTAKSYRKIIEYFRQNKELKVVGCTATPDRADESALGQIFDSVADDYEILDAVRDGWLVMPLQQMITVSGLDFSHCKTTAGDLNGADLAAIMEAEEVLQGVAAPSIEIIGNKRTLAFTSSVKHAEMLCEIFNRHRPYMAAWVCGKTPKEDRRDILTRFKGGEIQVLCNCGVLTEGFDCPEVEVIIQARPTKSRCLYAQIIGRSLRPLPGLVDPFETPEERRAAIAASAKPNALILDFVGVSGKHKLCHTGELLSGRFTDEEIEMAEKAAKKAGKPVDMTDEMAKAHELMEERKRNEAARKAKLVAKASYTVASVSAFDVWQVEPERERGWSAGKSFSEKQRPLLLKLGVNPDEISYHKGKQLIDEQFRRWAQKLCTFKQAKLLRRYGYETKDLSMTAASSLIDALAKNNWQKPAQPDSNNPF